MTDFDVSKSRMASLMRHGFASPSDNKLRFTMNSHLSDESEAHIKGAGEAKVFSHLRILTRGPLHGWIGPVTSIDLSQHFSKSRKKTTAQHYGRIISSLRERKMVFTTWINVNRKYGVHLNIMYVCNNPAQWDDIFTGCPIYPITLVQFLSYDSRKALIGIAWAEMKKRGMPDNPTFNANLFIEEAMAKTVATQFIPRMHREIREKMPKYRKGMNAQQYLDEVCKLAKMWPSYYGIEEAKCNASEKLKSIILEIQNQNQDKDFQDYDFASEEVFVSSVVNTTPETCSSVVNTTPEVFSSVVNTTPEKEKNEDVTSCQNDILHSPSCAREKRRGKIENDNREGVSKSDLKNQRDESANHMFKENKSPKKGEQKMDFAASVSVPEGETGFKYKNKKAKKVQKQTSEHSFWEEGRNIAKIQTVKGLFDHLRASMQKKHPRFSFNGDYKRNSNSNIIAKTLDQIKEDGYLDDEILAEWISWYVDVFMTPEKVEKTSAKFINTFTETWGEFRRTVARPEERMARRQEVMSHKISVSSGISDIENTLQRIFDQARSEVKAVESMLERFGVVIVGNWLMKKHSASTVEEVLHKILESMGIMELKDVYGSTVERESEIIKSGKAPFSDWRSKFEMAFRSSINHEAKPIQYKCEETDKFMKNLLK